MTMASNFIGHLSPIIAEKRFHAISQRKKVDDRGCCSIYDTRTPIVYTTIPLLDPVHDVSLVNTGS